MIVGSLLLILVAVTLLVLGLAAGSSTLLIISIVTSLLAAVALVVGARHAAGIRRAQGAAPERLAVDLDDDPGPAAPVGLRVDRDAGRAHGPDVMDPDPMDPDPMDPDPMVRGPVETGAADTEVFHQDAVFSQDAGDPRGPDLSEDPDPSQDLDPSEDERAGTPGLAGLHFSPDAGDSGRLDPWHTDAFGPVNDAGDPDIAPTGQSGRTDDRHGQASDRSGPSGLSSVSERPGEPGGEWEPERRGESHADFDRAQSVIGAARAQDVDDAAAVGHEPFEDDDYSADDPADEPPVQRIQPDEAVRVARMPTEVVVVDGRPRYHLADCPHLLGRSTEPLPVAEAVELGFTPCGLCRPVDRLVAKPARR